MSLEQEIISILQKTAEHVSVRSMLGRYAANLPKDDAEKLERGRWLDEIARNDFKMEPEDTVVVRKLLLSLFEEIGTESGNPVALRYASFAYGRGDNDLTVERRENGWTIHAAPDFARAVALGRKAVEAGDNIAAKALPGLERDLREKGLKP